jgi:hypothetical protein
MVATVATHDATTTLFFGNLTKLVPIHFAELAPRSLRHLFGTLRAEIGAASALTSAAALVVNRGLFEFANLIGIALAQGVPCYYFVDDNFMVLREEDHADARYARAYTTANVRRALAPFAGVLCATGSLREYFLEHRLHRSAVHYPPVSFASRARAATTDHRLRIGFFGGAHRREPFGRVVFPAIRRLAEDRHVMLFAAGIEGELNSDAPGLTVVRVPYNRDYAAALDAMAMNDIDILVHPSSDTANNAYKNPHVLINARALGAVPVFSDAPPYADLAGEGVCALTPNTEDGWLKALTAIADPGLRAQISARIEVYCDQHFSGAVNVRCLADMIQLQNGVQRNRPSPLLSLRVGGGLVAELARRILPRAGC